MHLLASPPAPQVCSRAPQHHQQGKARTTCRPHQAHNTRRQTLRRRYSSSQHEPVVTTTTQHAEHHQPLPTHYNAASWSTDAAGLLQQLQLPASTTPQQLWDLLATTVQPAQQQDKAATSSSPQQALDISTARLLMAAATATSCTQQQHNQLRPLIETVLPPLFPSFGLSDFRQLLQLCCHTRYVPSKEFLAAIYYADSGGFERLYTQEPPSSLVLLLCDLSAALSSITGLLQDLRQHTSLMQQQHQEVQDGAAMHQAAALQDAMQHASTNLAAIEQDPLLAGELSAVGGFWLLRRFLPAVQAQPDMVLQGLGALPGLGYKVLDADDADVLLGQLTPHLQREQSWSPAQLAAAVVGSLPCLGDVPPRDGQALALLFAAVGAAAAGMEPPDAARTLMVLAQLPGYAPDAQVAQALLSAALKPPLSKHHHLSARQLYQLLQAAAELGAAPTAGEMQLVQQFLSSSVV